MEMHAMSTASVPEKHRFESWRQAVCKMIHTVDVQPEVESFSASMTARRHGQLGCANFWSNAHTVRKSADRFSDAGVGTYLVSCQIDGDALLEQGDFRARLRPGSVAIVDARRAMEVHFPTDVHRLVANLPIELMERRLPFLARAHTTVLQPDGVLSQMLFRYFEELSSEALELQPLDFDLLAENICNLLAILTLKDGKCAPNSSELLKESVLRLVRQSFSNSDFSLEIAANKLCISKRKLQRVFQELESSFTEHLNEERLQAVDKVLRERSELAISQVAYQCGFSDISHFNHLYRRRFGLSPTERRNGANT